MEKVIIASHGDYSIGLKKSLEMIMGEGINIDTFSLYPGESAEDYANNLSNEVKRNSNKNYIVFTDILGGSVHTAMLQLCQYDNVTLISGVSLSLVLEVLSNLGEDYLEKVIEEAIEFSRDQFTITTLNTIKNMENEGDEELW